MHIFREIFEMETRELVRQRNRLFIGYLEDFHDDLLEAYESELRLKRQILAIADPRG